MWFLMHQSCLCWHVVPVIVLVLWVLKSHLVSLMTPNSVPSRSLKGEQETLIVRKESTARGMVTSNECWAGGISLSTVISWIEYNCDYGLSEYAAPIVCIPGEITMMFKYTTKCTVAHWSYGSNGTTANYIRISANYGVLHKSQCKLWSTTTYYINLGENYVDPITGDYTTVQPQLCRLLRSLGYCGFFLMEGAGIEHMALGNACDGGGYLPQAEANGTPADGRLTMYLRAFRTFRWALNIHILKVHCSGIEGLFAIWLTSQIHST